MTALANSLKRIWSAKNRVPHLTWWGTSGSIEVSASTTKVYSAYVTVRELVALARRTAPTIFVIAYNIFR